MTERHTRRTGRDEGDTAGRLARPKGVAVDGAGRVYVSDGLLAAVEVFAQDGTYLGLIGRTAPSDEDSETIFVVPAGLSVSDEQLLVTDRYAGVFSFDISETTPQVPLGASHAVAVATRSLPVWAHRKMKKTSRPATPGLLLPPDAPLVHRMVPGYAPPAAASGSS